MSLQELAKQNSTWIQAIVVLPNTKFLTKASIKLKDSPLNLKAIDKYVTLDYFCYVMYNGVPQKSPKQPKSLEEVDRG